jgi:hypothetical protein
VGDAFFRPHMNSWKLSMMAGREWLSKLLALTTIVFRPPHELPREPQE